MFDDDTRNPFDPNDNLPKPSIGDVLVLKPAEEMPSRLIVTGTHDDLAESWDPSGEDAWTMHDVNNAAGYKGHWYAYGNLPNGDDDGHVVASYEVERIEKQ